MDFISIDFETSNSQQCACAIGLALVLNNNIVDEHYTLINPERPFGRNFTNIHGIAEAHVVDSPIFPDVWATLARYFNRYPVVAHNALFDKQVLDKALRRYKITPLPIVYYDTMELYRHNYPAADAFNLPSVCDSLGVTLNNHHNALDDAKAAAGVMVTLLQNAECSIFPTLVSGIHLDDVKQERKESSAITSSFSKGHIPTFKNTTAVMCEVDGVVFADSSFVITGVVPGYERSTLEKAIQERGGRVTGAVTKKTSYVVVGLQDAAIVKDGAGAKSGKIIKAEALRDCGIDIKIISADDLLSALI
jgi:DNA polymerase-3 subunit epsilon